MKKKHSKEIDKKSLILSILRLMFFILFLVSIIYIARWIIDKNKNNELEQKISETVVVETIVNKEETENKRFRTSTDGYRPDTKDDASFQTSNHQGEGWSSNCLFGM